MVTSTRLKTPVLGLGNLILGDDSIGSHVVQAIQTTFSEKRTPAVKRAMAMAEDMVIRELSNA